MSVKVMSLVWGWALPATEKLVALKLADCADDRGCNAWPAVATIAADCGLSRRGTQEVLRRLVVKGCIEVQAGHTSRKSTTYRVRLNAQPRGEGGSDGGAPAAPLEVQSVRPSEVQPIPPEVQPAAGGGAPAARLEVHQLHPIRPGSVSDPSRTPRARDGREPHPLDEPPSPLPRVMALFDELLEVYPNVGDRVAAERAWIALELTTEKAQFIVSHVRVRVSTGWVRQAGGARYIPHLKRFLEHRRWEERAPADDGGAAVSGAPEGMRAIRCCDNCGAELEGSVRNGVPVYPPCARCARVRGGETTERGEERRT